MRKATVAGIVGLVALAGCMADSTGSGSRYFNAAAPSAIKIVQGVQERLLLGTVSTSTFGGSTSTDGYVHKIEQVIQATDGVLSCEIIGSVQDNNYAVLPMLTSYTTSIDCSDGRTGNVVVTNNQRNLPNGQNPTNGMGVGTLNDGSNVKVMFGDTVASMTW